MSATAIVIPAFSVSLVQAHVSHALVLAGASVVQIAAAIEAIAKLQHSTSMTAPGMCAIPSQHSNRTSNFAPGDWSHSYSHDISSGSGSHATSATQSAPAGHEDSIGFKAHLDSGVASGCDGGAGISHCSSGHANDLRRECGIPSSSDGEKVSRVTPGTWIVGNISDASQGGNGQDASAPCAASPGNGADISGPVDCNQDVASKLTRPKARAPSRILCRLYGNGCCTYGDSCWFKHGEAAVSEASPQFKLAIVEEAHLATDGVSKKDVEVVEDHEFAAAGAAVNSSIALAATCVEIELGLDNQEVEEEVQNADQMKTAMPQDGSDKSPSDMCAAGLVSGMMSTNSHAYPNLHCKADVHVDDGFFSSDSVFSCTSTQKYDSPEILTSPSPPALFLPPLTPSSLSPGLVPFAFAFSSLFFYCPSMSFCLPSGPLPSRLRPLLSYSDCSVLPSVFFSFSRLFHSLIEDFWTHAEEFQHSFHESHRFLCKDAGKSSDSFSDQSGLPSSPCRSSSPAVSLLPAAAPAAALRASSLPVPRDTIQTSQTSQTSCAALRRSHRQTPSPTRSLAVAVAVAVPSAASASAAAAAASFAPQVGHFGSPDKLI